MDKANPTGRIMVTVTDHHLQDIPPEIGYLFRNDRECQGVGDDLVRDKPDYAGVAPSVNPDIIRRRNSDGEGGKDRDWLILHRLSCLAP